MGTRADFYVGRGVSAEWLGSIGFDGYPDGDARVLLPLRDERAFRQAVSTLVKRSDGTAIEMGWPWPWEDSRTTDFSYSFSDAGVVVHNFGRPVEVNEEGELVERDDETSDDSEDVFPDMTDRQAVTHGDRSGALFVGLGGGA